MTSTTMSKPARVMKRPAKAPVAIKVADETLAGLSEVFKLLADKSRLKIVLALAQQGELHVSALCGLLRQTQPAVSHHLTLLRMTGMVGFRRDGKHNFYRVESRLVQDLLEDFFKQYGNGHRQLPFPNFSLVYKYKRK